MIFDWKKVVNLLPDRQEKLILEKKNNQLDRCLSSTAGCIGQAPPPQSRRIWERGGGGGRTRAWPSSSQLPLSSPAAASTAPRVSDLREGEGVVAAGEGEEGGAGERELGQGGGSAAGWSRHCHIRLWTPPWRSHRCSSHVKLLPSPPGSAELLSFPLPEPSQLDTPPPPKPVGRERGVWRGGGGGWVWRGGS